MTGSTGGVSGSGSPRSSSPTIQDINQWIVDDQTQVSKCEDTLKKDQKDASDKLDTYNKALDTWNSDPTSDNKTAVQTALDNLKAAEKLVEDDYKSLYNADIILLNDYKLQTQYYDTESGAPLKALLDQFQDNGDPNDVSDVMNAYNSREQAHQASLTALDLLRNGLTALANQTITTLHYQNTAFDLLQQANLDNPDSPDLTQYNIAKSNYDNALITQSQLATQVATEKTNLVNAVASFKTSESNFQTAARTVLNSMQLSAQQEITAQTTLQIAAATLMATQKATAAATDSALRQQELTTWTLDNAAINAQMSDAIAQQTLAQENLQGSLSIQGLNAIDFPSLISPAGGDMSISDLMKVLKFVRLAISQIKGMIGQGDAAVRELISKSAQLEISAHADRNTILYDYYTQLRKADIDYNIQVDEDNASLVQQLQNAVDSYNNNLNKINAVVDQLNDEIDKKNAAGQNLADSINQDIHDRGTTFSNIQTGTNNALSSLNDINPQQPLNLQTGTISGPNATVSPPQKIPHLPHLSSVSFTITYPPAPSQATMDACNNTLLDANKKLNLIQGGLAQAGISAPLFPPITMRDFIPARDPFVQPFMVDIVNALAAVFQIITNTQKSRRSDDIYGVINLLASFSLIGRIDAVKERLVSNANATADDISGISSSAILNNPISVSSAVQNAINQIMQGTRFTDLVRNLLEFSSIQGGLNALKYIPSLDVQSLTYGIINARTMEERDVQINGIISQAVALELTQTALDGGKINSVTDNTLASIVQDPKLQALLDGLNEEDLKALLNLLKILTQLLLLLFAAFLASGNTSDISKSIENAFGLSQGKESTNPQQLISQASIPSLESGITPQTFQNAALLFQALALSNPEIAQSLTGNTSLDTISSLLGQAGIQLTSNNLSNPQALSQVFSILTGGLSEGQRTALLTSLTDLASLIGIGLSQQPTSLQGLIETISPSSPSSPIEQARNNALLIAVSSLLAQSGAPAGTINSLINQLQANGIESIPGVLDAQGVEGLFNQAVKGLSSSDASQVFNGIGSLFSNLGVPIQNLSASASTLARNLQQTSPSSESLDLIQQIPSAISILTGTSVAASVASQVISSLLTSGLINSDEANQLIQGSVLADIAQTAPQLSPLFTSAFLAQNGGIDVKTFSGLIQESGTPQEILRDPLLQIQIAFAKATKEVDNIEYIEKSVKDFAQFMERSTDFSAWALDVLLNPGKVYIKNFSLMTRDSGDQNFHLPSQTPV